ncbi:hypothetical protein [Kribbella sp. NPDC051770]|uniref:hypothetical protein n=1 Tax=Kribbella sp. NPDC051770 TaxID=3155413 RepID=UPI0034175DE6
MSVPSRPEVFMISGEQRRLVADGPAIVDEHGVRLDVPPKALDALRYVEVALREGYAVQITLLPHELRLREAAIALEIPEDELRAYLPAGDVSTGPDDSDEWVQLDQVLQLQRRIRANRREEREQRRTGHGVFEEELEPDEW